MARRHQSAGTARGKVRATLGRPTGLAGRARGRSCGERRGQHPRSPRCSPASAASPTSWSSAPPATGAWPRWPRCSSDAGGHRVSVTPLHRGGPGPTSPTRYVRGRAAPCSTSRRQFAEVRRRPSSMPSQRPRATAPIVAVQDVLDARRSATSPVQIRRLAPFTATEHGPRVVAGRAWSTTSWSASCAAVPAVPRADPRRPGVRPCTSTACRAVRRRGRRGPRAPSRRCRSTRAPAIVRTCTSTRPGGGAASAARLLRDAGPPGRHPPGDRARGVTHAPTTRRAGDRAGAGLRGRIRVAAVRP